MCKQKEQKAKIVKRTRAYASWHRAPTDWQPKSGLYFVSIPNTS